MDVLLPSQGSVFTYALRQTAAQLPAGKNLLVHHQMLAGKAPWERACRRLLPGHPTVASGQCGQGRCPAHWPCGSEHPCAISEQDARTGGCGECVCCVMHSWAVLHTHGLHYALGLQDRALHLGCGTSEKQSLHLVTLEGDSFGTLRPLMPLALGFGSCFQTGEWRRNNPSPSAGRTWAYI